MHSWAAERAASIDQLSMSGRLQHLISFPPRLSSIQDKKSKMFFSVSCSLGLMCEGTVCYGQHSVGFKASNLTGIHE